MANQNDVSCYNKDDVRKFMPRNCFLCSALLIRCSHRRTEADDQYSPQRPIKCNNLALKPVVYNQHLTYLVDDLLTFFPQASQKNVLKKRFRNPLLFLQLLSFKLVE